MNRMETIHVFAISFWKQRIDIQHNTEKAAEIVNAGWTARIVISSLARNNVVGIDRAVSLLISVKGGGQLNTFLTTFSTRLEQNSYTTELIVIEEAIKLLSEALSY